MPQDKPTDPPAPAKKRIALIGTMTTKWRTTLKPKLEACGFTVIDNTDPRWKPNLTGIEKRPLLEQDIRIMRSADVVIWHHDAGNSNTSGVEIGMLTGIGPPVVIHMDAGANAELRSHILGLTYNFPGTLHWAESMDEAVAVVQQLIAPRARIVSPCKRAARV